MSREKIEESENVIEEAAEFMEGVTVETTEKEEDVNDVKPFQEMKEEGSECFDDTVYEYVPIINSNEEFESVFEPDVAVESIASEEEFETWLKCLLEADEDMNTTETIDSSDIVFENPGMDEMAVEMLLSDQIIDEGLQCFYENRIDVGVLDDIPPEVIDEILDFKQEY